MKLDKYIIALGIAILTAGCSSTATTPAQTSAVQIRYSAYLGKTLPLFILDNGSPYSQKKLSDGSRLYRWNSGRERLYHYSPFLRERDDDFMRSECEIRLKTSAKGRIIAITALHNPRKNWDADRCRDYLK